MHAMGLLLSPAPATVHFKQATSRWRMGYGVKSWFGTRSLHDQGVWGYQSPRSFQLPDFSPLDLKNRIENASLLRLVESYRKHGHRAAKLDPIHLALRPNVPALDPRRYGYNLPESSIREDFRSKTLPQPIDEATPRKDERLYDVSGILDFPQVERSNGGNLRSISEIATRLEQVYCSGVGYEFMHLPSKHERRFLEVLLESSHSTPLSPGDQKRNWKWLAQSEGFDRWCAKKFPNVKRYGLEGAEGMMVALGVAFEEAKSRGIEDIVSAMPHRGRLNLLTQLLDLDMRLLVRKMRGLPTLPPNLSEDHHSYFQDDVLSHLFLSSTLPSSPSAVVQDKKGTTQTGRRTIVHVLPNPSHLEAVNPVGLGFARGLQVPYKYISSRSEVTSSTAETMELGDKVLSLQVHGDAAFGGQGVVAESLNLASLPHFNVGGTVRIVVNNQLGYTTPATEGRTSFYATDLAKSIAAPIVHVNGDRIDDVARAMKLALAYQDKFRKDIIIDLVVYRRRGHNELDEPSYTSPLMYKAIASLPSVPQLYERQLLDSGVLEAAVVSDTKSSQARELDESLVAAEPENYTVPELEMARGWDIMKWPHESEWKEFVRTGVDIDTLRVIGKQSVQVSSDITPHPRLVKMHMSKRLQSLDAGKGIDFATAEALAFGSLMLNGYHVRLCGQDSGRGTFSQRHAIVSDQNSDRTTVPLQALTQSGKPSITDGIGGASGGGGGRGGGEKVGTMEVVNSPLSEYAVIGFEQGLSWVTPQMLPIWEAQFGDFLNTAQVMIDTYFGSGESKWGMQSGLTLLLPHGYDSAGPEHSSAKIERLLQLTNEPYPKQMVHPKNHAHDLKEMWKHEWIPNMHIVNVTTAAQYFHVLRRQMIRPYRKPLVVFSPKGILRLPAAASSLDEMSPGSYFLPVLDDPWYHGEGHKKEGVSKLVFCTGKVYYDLVKMREEKGLNGKIAFIRVEEISPFPYDILQNLIGSYMEAGGVGPGISSTRRSFAWVQEEPENAGAWGFISPRLGELLKHVVSGGGGGGGSNNGGGSGGSDDRGQEINFHYIGRQAMSSPAPGVASYFNSQKKEMMNQIFDME